MSSDSLLEERLAQLDEITRRRNDYLREMFILLERRNSAEVILTTEDFHGPGLEAFINRFDISKAQEVGSIVQLADSEFAPSPLCLRTPSPQPALTPEACQDAPMARPPDSPMSEALTPPSPLPPDVEMNNVAPEEDRSSELGDLRLPSPDIPLEHVDEPSLELSDEEPPLPLADVPSEDVPVVPSIASPEPECTSADTGPDTRLDTPQPEVLSEPIEDIEQIITSVTPMETELDQLAAEIVEESIPEALVSPEIVEDIYLQEDTDMDVDAVGEPHIEPDESITPVPEREHSAAPPTPPAHQTEVQPSPVASPVVALPPSAFILPPKPSTEVFIPVTLTPVAESLHYALDSANPEPRSLTVNEWLSPEFSLSRKYTLPPVKSIPMDQQRRLKLSKIQRKKDKEKDKGVENRKDSTEDWTPLGINKWGVTIKTNPLWKRVSRATKTMSTRDWNVAFNELRLVRVLERIDQLKETGKWSYRQPKKQRGVGNISKTHWDYLLDEMHWMRTDFREERRWKIAVAYKLSSAVLEWHSVGDRETRKERGIVVDWSRPVHDDSRDIDDVEMIIEHSQDVDEDTHEDSVERPFSSALISADYGSDDSDDEQELEKREVADALEPRTALEEALGHAERTMQLTTNANLKQDETHGPLTDGASHPGEMPQPDPHSGLKPTSDDPILGSDEILETMTTSTPKQHQKPSVYSPLRGHIAYFDYDKLVLDFDDLYIHKSRDGASGDVSHDFHTLPADISQIFPELPFTFIGPPTPSGPSNLLPEGKKRSEKRDRDDPHKRTDPTAYSKMTPMGVFMRTRPTLLAALNPAVRWEGDHWAGFDDAPIVPDFDAPHKILDEPTSSKILCVPFSPSLTPSQGLFDGGKPNLLIPDDDVILPSTPRDPARRVAADTLWTNQDDLLLKRLVEKYPRNWGLVADLFNSSRGAIVMEKRADWECKERYRSRWLGKERSERDFAPSAQDGPSSSTSARPLQSQITTRKRMASVSSSVNTSVTPATNFEPRKRRRHILMFETLRKVAKKRDAAQKAAANPRKSSAVHDTHGQFSKLPKLSPAELSRMKAEKEAQEILTRRRAEEAQRQQMLQRIGSGTPGQPHAQVALAQAQAQGQGQASPQPAQTNNGTRAQLNGQAAPQIRPQVNISQQQRIPPANASRLPPQQMLQVQAAQQRVLAVANANMNAAGPNTPHLSPGFSQRVTASSPVIPHSSPPRTSTTPGPPRPPSASQHPGHAQPSPNLAHAAAARQNPNPGIYYASLHGVQFTQEQMEQAMRIQQSLMEQEQLASLRAHSGDSDAANQKAQPSTSIPREDRDYEAGFGGQEDLEDRYATTSGEH
ncbi:hypothetical protein EI94DRAFT_1793607 [Lactarius quietus]|nr:hypothetical protein EI94DRAFT_1793607 [Lactarius quietus]